METKRKSQEARRKQLEPVETLEEKKIIIDIKESYFKVEEMERVEDEFGDYELLTKESVTFPPPQPTNYPMGRDKS